MTNPRQTFIIRATNKITGNDTKFRLTASSRRELQQILDRKYSNCRNFSITTEEDEERELQLAELNRICERTIDQEKLR